MASLPHGEVLSLLSENGYAPKSIRENNSGSNHYVFFVTTQDGTELVVKFPRVRDTEQAFVQCNEDTLFGGELSLEREAYLLDLVRQSGLPAPRVHNVLRSPHGDCVIVEKMPGQDFMGFMRDEHYSINAFLDVARCLGEDLRKLHKVRFASFGNIMAKGCIEPIGITNFADRYRPINAKVLNVCLTKNGVTPAEHAQLNDFFVRRFAHWQTRLSADITPPTLVITDLHGGNFFVQNSQISGYFDVESAQAAPPEFEIYALRFFVFNFFGPKEFEQAESVFWQAYTGGAATQPDAQTNELIDFFSACRLLEIFQSYWGYVDGLRDTWGRRVKDILFRYMTTGRLDYSALGDIWRDRDGQPAVAFNPVNADFK